MGTHVADEEQCAVRACMQCIQRYAALFISIILTITAVLVDSMFIREPYHTSIPIGKGWVMELLSGHPNCICCELGVSHDIFVALISELQDMGMVIQNMYPLKNSFPFFFIRA